VFAEVAKRPDIVLVSCENLSPRLGCYGDTNASTPALDAFAATAVRFERAYAVSGIGRVSRSAIQTGMFPSTIGTHTGGAAVLPPFVKTIGDYLKAAGYHLYAPKKPRPEGAPLFRWVRLDATNPSRIRLRGEAYERAVKPLKPEQRKSPEQLPFPPQFEDSEEARRDFANAYEMTSLLDRQFAAVLKGIPADAIVVFFGEYGFTLREGNSAAYESGTHVPMMIRMPGVQEAKADSQLIMLLDLAPTVLNLAGAAIPGHMQGRAFLGPRLSPPRRFVFATCDRPEERYELVRSVRDARYRYIRNFTRGTEELFDSNADPNEVKTVSDTAVLARLKERWERWRDETRDLGLLPEAELAVREAALGTRYKVGRQAGFEGLLQKLTDIASSTDESKIREAFADEDPAVRAWAVMRKPQLASRKMLTDASGAVRVNLAKALRKSDLNDAEALKVLLRALRSSEEWVRMLAVLAFEEIGANDLGILNALQAMAKVEKNRAVASVAARVIKGTA
jgi:uncharacterized sulfatase